MTIVEGFLSEQWPMVLIVIVVFITLLSMFAILGINFNPKKNKVIEKEVVIESYNNSVYRKDKNKDVDLDYYTFKDLI
jgi:hypothetical protein